MATQLDTSGVKYVPVERLSLDRENPRLASTLTAEPTQDDILRILWSEMAVDEVAISIAANGFYKDEPLLVIPEGQDGDYVVVEGNRRLVAVLLLRDKAQRERIRATNLPHISQAARKALDSLPVSIHPDRQSLWAYLGFRHVNGTKPWDAFSKAKYVADVHETLSVPLPEIATRIGDTHSTVKRLFNGYIVLRQAEKRASFSRDDRVKNRFYFSHLYTALDYPEFQEFLGITERRWAMPAPVPKRKLGELTELMNWLYGKRTEGIEPVVRRQNPDLNQLRRVVAKPSALSLLRTTGSLSGAHDRSIGDPRRFRDAVTLTMEELQKAKGTVTTGYKGEPDLFTMMEGISLTAETLLSEMKSKVRAPGRKRQA